MATTPSTEPSNYIQTLTRYLSNIMNSTLLGLPREIKELIYYDALNHAAEKILVSLYRLRSSLVLLLSTNKFAHEPCHTGSTPPTRSQEHQP